MPKDASKRRPISAAQWLAARVATEGAPSTRARVAAMLGCEVSAVYARAAAEGWKSVDFRRVATLDAWDNFINAASANAGSSGNDGAGGQPDGTPATDAGGGFDPEWADDNSLTQMRRASAGSAPADGPEAAIGEEENDDPVEMLARGVRFMSRRLTRLMRQAERGGQISKQEIDSLVAMMRMMERWETLAKERAIQEETDRDEKIAKALQTINRRILKLAREEAERLVAAEYRPDSGRAGEPGMAGDGEARPVSAVAAGREGA